MMMKSERGIAMVATLLVMLLMTALMVGFTTVVMSDQRFRGIDKDRTQAFYAAHSGLEKLTADLHNLFFATVAPTQAQLDAIMAAPPTITGITFRAQDGTNLYTLRVPAGGQTNGMVKTGPYQGLIALKTAYDMNATARTAIGGEVHLNRSIETVAIPVFQFGMFSDVDLAFFAGPQFNFGGRVHTNGNLFLASGSNANPGLTLSDKTTAVKDIIRQRLQNGASIDLQPHNFVVSQATAPGALRPLDRTEGSLVDGLGSGQNPAWTNLSLSTYNGYIRNGKTGAKPLNLPLLTAGGSNPDLVRRPPINSNENVANPTLFGERFFSQVSLRILLSDTAADITGLPSITGGVPLSLEGNWDPALGSIAAGVARPGWYLPVDGAHPGLARTGGNLLAAAGVTIAAVGVNANVNIPVNTAVPFTGNPPAVVLPATFQANNGNWFWCRSFTTVGGNQLQNCNVTAALNAGVISTPANLNYYLSQANTSTIGGVIKIERQDNNQIWTDVTQEIMQWGMTAHQQSTNCVGAPDPSPNAIIRLQRVKDVPNPNGGNFCSGAGAAGATLGGSDFWPLSIYDLRESSVRDVAPAGPPYPLYLGGVMYYVQLDVTNLSLWFRCQGAYAAPPAGYQACTGTTGRFTNGYSVYFSDRRNNRNGLNQETGEYGFEDVINPATAGGAPNGVLDGGEDVNANALLDIYGQNPTYNGGLGVPPAAAAPLNNAARPTTALAAANQVNVRQVSGNRPILYRRALKLVRAGLGAIVQPGLTISSENPVYVEGDWNAAAGFPAGAATSILADSVTLLSSNWADDRSYAYQYVFSGQNVNNALNNNPYDINTNRTRAAQSYYRFATIAGKPSTFPWPSAWGAPVDFGTDGGAHNFLRMLEGNGGTVNYRGSIATFYFSRQATGTFKCCAIVYGAPTRVFNFDTNFLTPALLPPLTPVFRDINALGFSQENRPGR